MKGFINFIREQGVVGLAVGFIFGGAISKIVSAIVSDIINPFIEVILLPAGGLKDLSLKIGPINILWGHFITVLVDFLVIALVVYFGVKLFKLDKLDKKKG